MSIIDFRGAQLVLVFDGTPDNDLVRRIESIFGSRDPGGDLGYGGTREDTGWRVRAINVKALDQDVLTTAQHSLVAYITSDADGRSLALPSCKSKHGLRDTNAVSVVVRMNCMPVDATTKQKKNKEKAAGVLDGAGDWEPAVRRDFVGLWLVAQAIRLVMNDLEEKDRKLRLFISHAKLDGVPLALAIRGQIAMLGALSDFYDVEDLDQTKDIELQLRDAVNQSTIIALRSDCYDERPWCRWEVERAEEYGCPVLVVDARTRLTHPASSLAYASSPGVRIPDGNTLRILAETLRLNLRTALARRRLKDAGAQVSFIPRTPSILSLMQACRRHKEGGLTESKPLHIVYPDPPLERGAWEAAKEIVANHSPCGRVGTVSEFLVLQGAADPDKRPLTGLTVGLSMAEPENLAAFGFTKADVNRFIIRFSETLLGLGARLVFGHDWRHGGIMEMVSEAAIRYRPLSSEKSGQDWSVLNLVPWPDKPALEPWRRDQIKDVIQVEEAGVPSSADDWRHFAHMASGAELPQPPSRESGDELESRWWRACALSHLRVRLNGLCDARVCLGGKVLPKSENNPGGHSGWFPGVIEEAFHAMSIGQPVFVGSLFGGASQLMAQAFEKNQPPKVDIAEDLMIHRHGIAPLSPADWWAKCEKVSQPSALADADRERLHQTQDMEEFLLLVVKGLMALPKASKK